MEKQQGPGFGTPAMPQRPLQDKMDNISIVNTLMVSLSESIPATLNSAAQILHQNHNTDSNAPKTATDGGKKQHFDNQLGEFYSLCDQMELHLHTAIICTEQARSAGRYLPMTVKPSRLDPGSTHETTLSYPQYLNTVQLQIAYAKDIHDTMVAATQNISWTE